MGGGWGEEKRTEFNYRIPSWCQRIAYCCGNSHCPPHTLDLGVESLIAVISTVTLVFIANLEESTVKLAQVWLDKRRQSPPTDSGFSQAEPQDISHPLYLCPYSSRSQCPPGSVRIGSKGGWRWVCCYCSVAQSYPTLCDPMDRSTPGFFVLHYHCKYFILQWEKRHLGLFL